MYSAMMNDNFEGPDPSWLLIIKSYQTKEAASYLKQPLWEILKFILIILSPSLYSPLLQCHRCRIL